MDSIKILTRVTISLAIIAAISYIISRKMYDQSTDEIGDNLAFVLSAACMVLGFFSFVALLLIFVIRELKK
jgi:hypothetical protein